MTMSVSAAAAASALPVASLSSVSWTTSSAPTAVSALEPARVTSGADHPPGAEQLGHLDGHRSRVAGRAEDEHALSWLDRNAAAQGDPRRHRRVHRGGDLRDIGVVGQLDRAARVDQRLVRHRADHVVGRHEVDPPAVGPLADARRCRGSSAMCRCWCSAPRRRRSGHAGAGRRRGRRPASRPRVRGRGTSNRW